MKRTIELHVYWSLDHKGEPRIRLDEYDMRKWPEESRAGRVWVKTMEVEVEIPADFDPRPERIANLRAEQQRLRAEMHARIEELNVQINKLLALEMA